MQTLERRLPWVTLAIAALSAAATAAPGDAQNLLVYDRGAVLHGELWRLWTGHLVHFSARHLAWNLLVVGAAGAWIERARFPGAGWLLAAAPVAISGVLLAGDPGLRVYGGLSGAANAAVTFACAAEWRRGAGSRVVWAAVLAAIAAKIAWEFHSGTALFARYGHLDTRTVPLAHLAGACAGLTIALLAGKVGWPRPGDPSRRPNRRA